MRQVWQIFTLPALIGSVLRIAYQLFNNLELPDSNFLKKNFPFPTRFPIIDQNMLTLPLLASLLIILYSYFDPTILSRAKSSMRTAQEAKRFELWNKVITKWVLSYVLFIMIYTINNKLLMDAYDFDPSGHFLCAMVSYSNWFNLWFYTQRCYRIKKAIQSIYYILIVYQLYCLIFTTLVYHSYSETLYGYLNGLFVSYIVFGTEIWTDAIFEIFYYLVY